MAITTVNGLVASTKNFQFWLKSTVGGVTGRPQSFWGVAGIPGAGSFDTTLNGVTLSATSALVSGQIPFYDPTPGQSTYMSRFMTAPQNIVTMLLCDRLWHNGGFTITSAGVQNITSPTWPARDQNGSTNGLGVYLGLEISAAAGAAAPTVTIIYTNSDGTGSRTGTLDFPTSNSPPASVFYPIALQQGDVGVRSVQSLQLSTSWISGTMNLVAYRIISVLGGTVGQGGTTINVLKAGLPIVWNGSVPFIIVVPFTTAINDCVAYVEFVQG